MIGLNGDTELQAEREATYPPPYPEAWYVVARAADVSDQPTQVVLAVLSEAERHGRRAARRKVSERGHGYLRYDDSSRIST